jgi:phosphonate transport system substrate-binding protein
MKHMTRTLATGVAAAALSLSIASGAAANGKNNPDTLRVALLPDENASTVIKNNEPLKAHLEKSLGKKIKLVVTTDYSSMIEAMRFGRLELAYFGPLSYTMAASKSKIEAFAGLKKRGSTSYHAVVIANKKAGIDKIADIKGKNMAYRDTASTSSHLIPKKMLVDAGLQPKQDYKEHFLGAHDAVAVAVQNGHAQAGGLSQPIFKSLVSRGIISMDKVKVLGVSPAFPQYPWAMRSDLDAGLKQKIKAAFIELKDKKVLKPFKADGFGAMTDKDFDVVRDLSKALGLRK